MKKVNNNRNSRNEDRMVQEFLKVVSDNNRLRILSFLGKETYSVTQIHKKLRMPQNLASHHISKLKEIGLLNEKKEGTFRFYSVSMSKMRQYNQLFRKKMGI